MDLSYSPDETAFRDEVRAWLGAHLPVDIRDKVTSYRGLAKEDHIRWHKTLAAKGWSVPHWPVEWGGTGWNITQRYIYDEEFGLAGAPSLPPFGPSMCASVLLRFGTPEQQRRFLPRIREGDDFWVQGYSEPGAGSDLAALKTRAEKRGDHYLINGQKIWTTLGHYGDWIFCLVRTDSAAEKRQEALLLRVAAEAQQHRRTHARAEGRQHRRAGQAELFVVDVALRDVPAGAAPFHRPVRHRPALGGQDPVPAEMVVLAQVAVAGDLVTDVGRQVRGQPAAHLVAEGQFLGRIVQVHVCSRWVCSG